MKLMYDAVYPQTGLNSTQYQVVAGYAGGDTPHVWSRAEWDSTPQRYRLPIWVRSNPAGHNGTDEARQFYGYLQSIGCPHNVAVALDYETAVDGAYMMAFESEMYALGHFETMLYGSLSTVVQNIMPYGGYWIAEWDNLEDFPANCKAHQFINHPNYDASVISDSVVLWDTRPVLPTPAPVIGDDVFSYLKLDTGDSYIPCEGAGTLAASRGGAKIGPEWLHLASQGNGTVDLYSNAGGKWTKVLSQTVSPGGRVYTEVPGDGTVSMYKVVSTTPLIAYLVGVQL